MADQTVTQRHIEFARAVVALARQHGMDNLTVSYRESLTACWRRDEKWNSEQVTATWHEGRHGDQSRLNIEYRATVSVDERARTAEQPQGAAIQRDGGEGKV